MISWKSNIVITKVDCISSSFIFLIFHFFPNFYEAFNVLVVLCGLQLIKVLFGVFFTKIVVDFQESVALGAFIILLFFTIKLVHDKLSVKYDSFLNKLFQNTRIIIFVIKLSAN